MTDLTGLRSFAAGSVAGWQGLPSGLRLDDLTADFELDPDFRLPGERGRPSAPGTWVPAESAVFDGGLRLWLDGDEVVVVEGVHPLGPDGQFTMAPDLGQPEAVLDGVLGPLVLENGEHVYAGRGLSVRVNPENGLLLGLLGFVSITVDDYVARLRPVLVPTPLVPGAVT